MPNRMSVATISSPEFINISGVSPFASKAECKVFYLGQNRNGSAIDKSVATAMAQTLPACPIVGYYSESKEDFRDHGDMVTIDGDGVHFKCQTVPYGFVAPDAKIWFQDFEDTDEFGNSEIRTYLMTECYLWTGQYEEAKKVLNEGRPQSMELDENTLKGHWATDSNRGIDFFIINDAIFTKLCILGEDVEPCFEGASVTAPKVSSSFSMDESFTKTLYSMMQELKELTYSLHGEGGKEKMEDTKDLEVQAPSAEENAPIVEENVEFEKNSNLEDKIDSDNMPENQNTVEEFKKKEEDSDSKEEQKDDSKEDSSDANSDDETDKANEEDDEEKKKAAKNTLELEEKFSLLETQYNELQEKFASLEKQNEELSQFKLDVENKEKDELIASFYMLSEDDKKDVIENKAKYSLEDIESNLSVICDRKKVSFNEDEEEKSAPTIFNLNSSSVDSDLPAWLKAVEKRRNND